MPQQARLLTEGEEILHQSPQHWIALRDEIAYTLAWLVLWILVVPWLDFALDEWVAWLLTLVWAGLVGYGVTRWYSTDLIVTTKRLIYRKGIFEKSDHEIELPRLVDVGYRQTLWQRLLGAGDLLLDSGGHEGKSMIRDVPAPADVSNVLDEVRASRSSRRLPGEPPPETPPSPSAAPRPSARSSITPRWQMSRAEQLDILARLHTEGKLTDEEFMAEKRRVLESD